MSAGGPAITLPPPPDFRLDGKRALVTGASRCIGFAAACALAAQGACPTFVDTELARATLADPERRAWIMSRIRLGRLATTQDLTGPLILLASDAGAMMTGTALIVDGGWTAG